MLIEIQSDKSVEQLREDLPKAAIAHKFGVFAVHDLRAKMKEKGVDFDRDVLVFEVCNPHRAKAVLDVAPKVSSVLPCRISVFSDSTGKVHLTTIRPTLLVGAMTASGIEDVAEDVEHDLLDIMNDAK